MSVLDVHALYGKAIAGLGVRVVVACDLLVAGRRTNGSVISGLATNKTSSSMVAGLKFENIHDNENNVHYQSSRFRSLLLIPAAVWSGNDCSSFQGGLDARMESRAAKLRLRGA